MSKDSNGSSFQCAFEKALEAISTTEPKELDGRIECEVCKGIFFMRHHFDSHICNNKAKHISCSVCQKTFKSRFRLRQHSYLHSGEKPVECKICKKRFSCTYIWRHMQTHSNKKRYKCKICGNSYRFSDTLKFHIYSHTGEKPHKCKYCGRQFRLRSTLRVHLTTHEEKTIACPICPRVFPTKSHLKIHMAIHENNKPFKCETCGKCFVLKISLEKHAKIHLRKKPFECEHCSKKFARKESLSVHIKSFHEKDASGLEKCHICNKQFLYKSRLEKHLSSHNKYCLFCIRPSDECTCMENSEKYGDSLKRPFARDNFMFKCQTCSKIILRQVQLKKHMLIHREYKCVICDEDFWNCTCSDSHMEVSQSKNTYQRNKNKDLKKLEEVDSQKSVVTRDNFMFKCRTCSRIILHPSQLKVHLRVHKDYECVVCNKYYRNCSCTDDYMEVTRSINTYQKSNRTSSNAQELLAEKTVEEEGSSAVEVKEGVVTFINMKCDKECIQLDEAVVPKEEPKEECIDIDETEDEPSIIKVEYKEIEQ